MAQASPLSFLSNLFGKIDESVAQKSITSQNVALLEAALNRDPNPQKGGGDVTVVGDALYSDSGPLGTTADVSDAVPSSSAISIYVVRKDDSLSQIAKMFGVSINTIIWANDIPRGNLIREGQTLVILPISGVRHTVAKGDTISSIAKKYKGDLEEIKSWNDISDSSELAEGQVIVVPDGEIAGRVYTSTQIYTPVRGTNGPVHARYYTRPVPGARTQGLHGYNGVDLAGS